MELIRRRCEGEDHESLKIEQESAFAARTEQIHAANVPSRPLSWLDSSSPVLTGDKVPFLGLGGASVTLSANLLSNDGFFFCRFDCVALPSCSAPRSTTASSP